MEMTPHQVWWLFEELETTDAESRLASLDDLKAVLNSVLSENGHKSLADYRQLLARLAGLTSSLHG